MLSPIERLFFLVPLVLEVWITQAVDKPSNNLLVISMDGFRSDATNDLKTPNFDWITRNGAKAKYVTPAMITLTAVDHTTIATGLYPESHGVVHNEYFDIETGERLDFYQTCNSSEWYDGGGEPIWVTAMKQRRKAGVYKWPGGTVSIKGITPDYAVLNYGYGGIMDWHQRIDIVLSWFVNNSIDLGLLYFNEPDYTIHSYGTNSNKAKAQITKCDNALQYLREEMTRYDLLNTTNVIVLSDHGHLNYIDAQNIPVQIELFHYINETDLKFCLANYGPVALLTPKPGKLNVVYNALKTAHPNMTVYKKEEFPDFYHYANNPRVPDIIALSDPGYEIFTLFPDHARSYNFMSDHGYDNRLMEMKTIFYAFGPDIRNGVQLEPFEAVDIYPLMAELLRLKPASNNGSLEIIGNALRSRIESTTPIYTGGANKHINKLSTFWLFYASVITLCFLSKNENY